MKKNRPSQTKKNATAGSGKWGKGQPARSDYQFKSRPESLASHPRADGRGTRDQVRVQISDSCDLLVLNRRGRPIDQRLGAIKEAKSLLAQLVDELGGPEAITFRQRLQLEIVIRRIIVSRASFESDLKSDSGKPSAIGINSDRVLLQALQQVYR